MAMPSTKVRVLLAAVVAALAAIGLISSAATTSAAPAPAPSTAVRFTLSAGDEVIATFAELTGLTSEVAVIEYIDGSAPATKPPQPIPGRPKVVHVQLERGVSSDMQIWAWHELARTDPAQSPKDVTLTAFDAEGDPFAKWLLYDAWPSKLDYGITQKGLFIEAADLVAQSVQRVAP